MERLRILLSRCAALFRKKSLDAELDEEMRAHIEMATEENLRRGICEEDARRAALIAFGGVTQIRETYRVQRGVPAVEQVARDVRFAVRRLRKSPAFALVAVATLAVGVGAVTSVFSVVNTVLLKPFPFRDPGRLVVIREVVEEPSRHMAAMPDNYRHYTRLRQDAETIEDAAIFHQILESVSASSDRPGIVSAVKTSPNLLRLLGVEPILGRDFVDADAERGAARAVVLTYTGWQTLFAGDPKVIGRTLRMGGYPATVVGVLPPEMQMPRIALSPELESPVRTGSRETMLFEPFAPSDRDLRSDTADFNYIVAARMKEGVSAAAVSAELETLQHAHALSAHLPFHLGIVVTPLAKDVTAGIDKALWLMFAAVGGVLLIACVDLANLQLARAVSAQRETAVRAALGASKGQLLRSHLAESLVLAAAGGIGGAALAFAGVRIFVALGPANIPRLHEVQVNLPVLLFAAGLSMVTALLFGTLPAMFALRVQPQTALQTHSMRASNTRESQRTRSTLVAAQVACTLVLLVVTALVLRSFSHLLRQDRGFDSSHVTVAQVDLFAPQYSDNRSDTKAAKLLFADRTLTALRQLPGVQSVAVTSAMPMTGETWIDELTRPDHPVPRAQKPLINLRWINEDYLATMQIPLVSGRNFAAGDRANPYVALISEKTAREGFAGENPIGQKISDVVPDSEHSVTVVGVVADARINGLKDTAPMVYLPYWGFTPWTISFLVRSSQPSDAFIPELRRTIWNIDPQVAIPLLKSMDEQVADSVATDRFQAMVLTSFGAAALLLALLGVYGVMAYSVSLGRQEFGIRIALGSGRAALMKLVARQAAYPVLLGAGIGLGLALLALRWVRSLLYEAPVMDPLAIGGSLLLLLAASALAALLPARRAASTDPMGALRTD